MNGSRKVWILVAALWPVAALNYLDRQVIFSVFPPLRAELKLSDVELGLLGTAFLWVYAVLSPISGYLADRFGRARVIVVSLMVWSSVTLATGQVHDFAQLIGARALMGISEAFYLPAALALIVDRHGESTRSLATGIHTSGIYAGMIAGGASGGWLAQQYGWRAPFTILGLAGLIYLLLLFPVMRLQPKFKLAVRPRFAGSVRELFRLPGYNSMMAIFVGTSMANWTFYTWLPLYLYEHFHLGLAAAGAYTMYTYTASVAGILAGGAIADRRGRVLVQTIGVGACVPALCVMAATGSVATLVPALIVYGLGKGFYDCSIMPVLAHVARPELRSTGYGLFNLGGCLAGGVMAPLAGWLKQSIGMEGAFFVAAAILALSAVLLLRLRVPEHN
jgi:MFS transporter, Spinster family, sphingosine-1-phosphate transporter